jgi:hypothetical protein
VALVSGELPKVRFGTLRYLLFFVDETWQTVTGTRVGALGGIALRHDQYNGFCAAFYRMKKETLGASELTHSEVKGTHCFSKSAFKAAAMTGSSYWLETADKLLGLLAAFHAQTFVIWSTDPDSLTLRQPNTTALSNPYRQLLFDFRALMEREAPDRLGSLMFDLRGTREDEATACTLQNYMVRTRGGWDKHFICVPSFTVSSVSPGLQAADVVSYLGAHLYDRNARPEIQSFVSRTTGLAYQFTRPGTSARRVTTARRVG